jgi:hypothetical protein
MSRSTNTERAERLNAAFDQIALGGNLNEAAEALVEQFSLSRRQAYRYLQQAQQIKRPVSVPAPIVAITIKVPADVVIELRAYAQNRGVTIGATVAHALRGFLRKTSRHG